MQHATREVRVMSAVAHATLIASAAATIFLLLNGDWALLFIGAAVILALAAVMGLVLVLKWAGDDA